MIDGLGDCQLFVAETCAWLKVYKIDRSEVSMLDHLCYRVTSKDRYRKVSQILGAQATLLGEHEIGQRMISTFELDEPIAVAGWSIPCIELPEPKKGSPYPEGLEHAEFVVVGSLKKFVRAHKDLSFDTSGMNKPTNPDVSLTNSHGTIKFHEQALGEIVRIEQTLGQTA